MYAIIKFPNFVAMLCNLNLAHGTIFSVKYVRFVTIYYIVTNRTHTHTHTKNIPSALRTNLHHLYFPLPHLLDIPLGGVVPSKQPLRSDSSPRKRQDSYRLLDHEGGETGEGLEELLEGDVASLDSYALAMEGGGYVLCVCVCVCGGGTSCVCLVHVYVYI